MGQNCLSAKLDRPIGHARACDRVGGTGRAHQGVVLHVGIITNGYCVRVRRRESGKRCDINPVGPAESYVGQDRGGIAKRWGWLGGTFAE